MQRMSCGNCGYSEFSIRGDDNHKATQLEVTCLECKSTTSISIGQPTMVLDWGDTAEGVLCFLNKWQGRPDGRDE